MLGEQRQLPAQCGWDDSGQTKLWRYNLHYFDDLTATLAESRRDWQRALIVRWCEENPPGQGSGWEPYPTSLRIVNWVKAARCGLQLDAAARHSLAVQTRWLEQRLEWHLGGNHLLANAKALVAAGCYFAGDEGGAWLRRGMALWTAQLREQILADGAHYELSPMYHSIVLCDLLDLINLLASSGLAIPSEWRECATTTLRWLGLMCHPDGEIAFFNDAAFGIAPTPSEIAAYAQRLGIHRDLAPVAGCLLLAASGYVRMARSDAVVLIDCAEVGPPHLPAHAHADTLSFELSLYGQRVLVNSGTSQYGQGQMRQYQRSTAAHNTVELDAADSSEVWAGFRVARRAHPADLSCCCDEAHCLVRSRHDGYLRLRGRNLHTRSWQLADNSLSISDEISGTFSTAVARFHIHPEVRAEQLDDEVVRLVLPDGSRATLTCVGAAKLSLAANEWYPEFGVSLPSQRLSVEFHGERLQTTLRW
jgi:uncharacterized heparinase superfamily protein